MRRRSRVSLLAMVITVGILTTGCISGGASDNTANNEPTTAAPLTTTASSGDTGSTDGSAAGSPAGSPASQQSTAPALKPTGTIEVVSFYPAGSADYKRLQATAARFEATYPGTTVKLIFGGGENTPKIQARWRAGNPPEVNYGFFDGTTQDGRKYATAGQVQALDKWLDAPLQGYDSSWRDAIYPSVIPYISLNDKTYAAPESISTIQLFYNKKIFADQGISVPKTLDDLLAAAAKIKAAGISPFALTGTFNPYMQLWFDYLLLRRAGAKAVQGALTGTTNFASVPGVKEAAADLEKMIKAGYFMEGFQSTDFTAAQLDFFQGKSAMIMMGSWLLGEMKGSIPADFEVGTFAFPSISGGTGDETAVFGGVNGQVVATQSKNPAGGVAWLQFIAQKSNQDAFVKDTGQISAYTGVAAPAGFQDVVDRLDKPDAFVPSYFGVLGAGKPVSDGYEKPIAELFFGKKTAAQMVAAIDGNLRAANGG
jgi:raffinose/stachyose/melibiose transport system substrate-binding protein